MGYTRDLDGCGQFIKYSMFIANFVIFLGGLAVLILGVWTLADKSYINELLGTNLYIGVVYIMIFTGAVVTLVSCFGCLGSAREVRCMLLLYSLILLLIFVILLVGGILGFVFREKVTNTMEHEMQSTLRWYDSRREIRHAWDETQTRLHCCGVVNYRDWQDRIPESCCREPIPGKKLPCRSTPSSLTLYSDGCLNVANEYFKEHAAIVGGVAIGVSILLLLGTIFSFTLFKMIK